MSQGKFTGGVRVHHETLKNTIYVIPVLNRPYKAPFMCPQCAQVHHVKTYHINLDNEGDAIVSREIVDALKKAQAFDDFEVVNVVTRPPTQTLDFGGSQNGKASIIEKRVG